MGGLARAASAISNVSPTLSGVGWWRGKGILEALAQDLEGRGELDLSECFIDGTFVVAKKGGRMSVRLNGQVEQAKRLKEVEKENARLRKAVADLMLDKLILEEAAKGNV